MDNFPLPGYIDREAWDGFVEMRKAMPKTRPFTHRAAVLILKELQRIKDAGHCPNAALDQSTMRGWSDVWVANVKEMPQARAHSGHNEEFRRQAEQAEKLRDPEEQARIAAQMQKVRSMVRRVA